MSTTSTSCSRGGCATPTPSGEPADPRAAGRPRTLRCGRAHDREVGEIGAVGRWVIRMRRLLFGSFGISSCRVLFVYSKLVPVSMHPCMGQAGRGWCSPRKRFITRPMWGCGPSRPLPYSEEGPSLERAGRADRPILPLVTHTHFHIGLSETCKC